MTNHYPLNEFRHLSFYGNLNKKDKYLLYKDNNDIDEDIKIDEVKNCDDKFIDYLVNFCKIMKDNFSSDNLSNLKRNLKSLKITHSNLKHESSISDMKIIGLYDSSKNKIKVRKKELDKSIYHELLHMASTNYRDDNIDYSGLSISFFDNDEYIKAGTSLNEGYTEVLNKRYFQNQNYISAYPFESYVSVMLENIVGKEKMESFYLNANLEGLIKDLSSYDNVENIIAFIKRIDLLYSYDNYKDRNNNLFNIISFLVRLSINKSYSDNFFNDEEEKERLKSFIESIPCRIRLDEEVFEFDIQSMVDDEFDKITSKNIKTLKK